MDGKPRSRWRIFWLTLGWLLIAASPLVGVVPGPGGVFVFAAGAALLIRNSCWAKRHYVRLKRRWPRLGRATDRVMRRGKRPAEAID